MSRLRKTVLGLVETAGECSGCHRIPERSFFYKGRQFPVCARCTGVVIGQTAAVIANFFIDIKVSVSFLCLFIMGTDWGLQAIKIKESTNKRRLVTGLLGGFGLFNLYCKIIKHIFRR